jgi:hypothetical protein
MMKAKIILLGALTASILSPTGQAREVVRRPAKAQVLDFSVGDKAKGFVLTAADTGGVGGTMVADFSLGFRDAAPSETRAPLPIEQPFNVVAARNQGFVRSPAVFVPAWMRSGRGSLTGQLLPPALPVIGNCGARDYSVSGLLKAEGEERRRILYPLVVQAACRYGIPVGLFDAMIMQESRYNVFARSPKGAMGLGQLMPGTAAQLGVDPYNIIGNLDGTARYFASHLREFNQPGLALAAYNAGPVRVRKGWAIPRIAETQDYVRQILWNWRTLEWKAEKEH